GSFITGGGYVNVTASSGTRKADSGTRMNFGYNVKTTKSGKNYQGHVNVIFRAGGRTYQIKSTAIDTLGVVFKDGSNVTCAGPPSSTCWGLANFSSKANLTDITSPLAPISLGGGLQLVLTMTDKGEPGT